MKYQTYTINNDDQAKNVYYFLKNQGFSENYISNLRKSKESICLNGEFVNTRARLNINDKLSILTSPNAKTNIKPCILPLDIVFEDAYYLLVYKPSGISCMPNKSCYDLNLAGAIVKYMKDKDNNFTLRIINRLDKDTAGFILVAKSSLALQEVKNINKVYFAICEGKIIESVTINKKIETISQRGINLRKRIISPNGKDATTYVSPIKYSDTYSLIKLQLIHGRTHQIRLHLASIGHSLLGDEIYGSKSNLILHTALICNEFSFFHPYRKEMLSFTHPFPHDFQEVCKKLSLIQQ